MARGRTQRVSDAFRQRFHRNTRVTRRRIVLCEFRKLMSKGGDDAVPECFCGRVFPTWDKLERHMRTSGCEVYRAEDSGMFAYPSSMGKPSGVRRALSAFLALRASINSSHHRAASSLTVRTLVLFLQCRQQVTSLKMMRSGSQ